jgi:invasion protein IalB
MKFSKGKLTIFPLALLGLISVHSPVWSSTNLDMSKKIGNWTVFCKKTSMTPSMADCGLVSGAVSEKHSEFWVRAALAFDQDAANAKMTIRVPRLDYFQKGISVSTELRQIGLVHIDRCTKDWCQSEVRVEPRILQALLTAKTLRFEYQIDKNEGVSIGLDITDFSKALAELQTAVLPKNRAMAAIASEFEIALRNAPWSPEMLTASTKISSYGIDAAFGAIVTDCPGTSPTMRVLLSADLKIHDESGLKRWLNSLKQCPSRAMVVSIVPAGATSTSDGQDLTLLEQVSMYQLAKSIRRNTTARPLEVVVTDVSGVPQRVPFWDTPDSDRAGCVSGVCR